VDGQRAVGGQRAVDGQRLKPRLRACGHEVRLRGLEIDDL